MHSRHRSFDLNFMPTGLNAPKQLPRPPRPKIGSMIFQLQFLESLDSLFLIVDQYIVSETAPTPRSLAGQVEFAMTVSSPFLREIQIISRCLVAKDLGQSQWMNFVNHNPFLKNLQSQGTDCCDVIRYRLVHQILWLKTNFVLKPLNVLNTGT